MNHKMTASLVLGILFLVMTPMFLPAQNSVPDRLKQRFIAYTKDVPREEIFVHSDREAYISGEVVWLALYLVNRQTMQPSHISRLAYVELVDDRDRPVIQKRFRIYNGFGPGQFVLPDTLATGSYTLRSYTHWMHNFMPDNVFEKRLVVYNALRNRAPQPPSKDPIKSNESTSAVSENSFINSGLHLFADNTGVDSVVLRIITGSVFRALNMEKGYIVIQSHGSIGQVSKVNLTADTTRLAFSRKTLGAGLNEITAFNAKGEPVGQLFCLNPLPGPKVDLVAPDQCGRRSLVSLQVDVHRVPGDTTAYFRGSLSVSPVISDLNTPDIDQYLTFGTEYGRNTAAVLSGLKADTVLTNLSSSWINWRQILGGSRPEISYMPEHDAHFLPGRLYTADQQPAKSGQFVFMCQPGKKAAFQYAQTDGWGNFIFPLPIDDLNRDLILEPADPEVYQKAMPDLPFSDRFPFPGQAGIGTFPSQLSKWSVNYQVQKLYGQSTYTIPHAWGLSNSKRVCFYGKPDFELRMADYISLPTMEEVFYEIIPHVSLKKRNPGYEITITDRLNNQLYSLTPTLMIDGVIIHDPSLIVNMDPDSVEKIDVIKVRYVVGHYYFPGIVNVITKSGRFSSVSVPDYMTRMVYRVAEPIWTFRAPDYSDPSLRSDRIPDYRTTLYWNPSVRMAPGGKAILSFWTGDNPGRYRIDLEGMTAYGPVTIRKIIVVK